MRMYLFQIIVCFVFLTTFSANANEVFVKETGSGDLSGKDWNNAFPGDSLVRLIYRSPQGSTIYVAEGLYNPYHAIYQSDGRKLMYDKDCTFIIPEGVSVFGGYSSQSTGKSLDKRNPKLYKTLLSGDMGCNILADKTVFLHNSSVVDGCHVDGKLHTGIGTVISNKATVYIANGILHIKSTEEIKSTSLYNIIGKLVYRSKNRFYSAEIQLNTHINSNFILILTTDKESEVYKF